MHITNQKNDAYIKIWQHLKRDLQITLIRIDHPLDLTILLIDVMVNIAK